jgi:hypothetical protein
VRWDSVGIASPLKVEPALSEKDAAAATFDDWMSPFTREFGGEST